MSQKSIFDIVDKFNYLTRLAVKGADNFCDELCNFFISDFGLQASVLFRVINNELVVLGKSTSAKKNYLSGAHFNCSKCKLIKNIKKFSYSSNTECELQISEFLIYESCFIFDINNKERCFLKIAK